jgi:drug/metabolite transporter (DMT)-like permease
MRTISYTALALVAFAANSVLCRIALHRAAVDAATFSTVRLTTGAATLLVISAWTRKGSSRAQSSWISAGMLFLYAVPFSFAYARLSAGTGALILFGSVQVTMMVAALSSGERPHPLQWLGLALALVGLVYLVLPGLEAPPLAGAALMALAGFSWGVYSLRGRSAVNPLEQTTVNFMRTVPLVLVVSLLARSQFHAQRQGVLLAIASGALASALGYVVWYEALRGLTATRAATVQLLVPILAAVGGVIFLAESISARLVLSAGMVLGGIASTLIGRERLSQVPSPASPNDGQS